MLSAWDLIRKLNHRDSPWWGLHSGTSLGIGGEFTSCCRTLHNNQLKTSGEQWVVLSLACTIMLMEMTCTLIYLYLISSLPAWKMLQKQEDGRQRKHTFQQIPNLKITVGSPLKDFQAGWQFWELQSLTYVEWVSWTKLLYMGSITYLLIFPVPI